jgi:hypothetical protein
MNAEVWFWIAFNAGVLCLLAIDLFAFHRKAHRPKLISRTICWYGSLADLCR